jgi:phosphoribosylamine--glycine ligase
VVAAHTALPVLGVPLASGALQGIDALLSTVQMPPGVPVATLGIGSAGGRNAAFLAARILALTHPEVKQRLAQVIAEDRERVLGSELPEV